MFANIKSQRIFVSTNKGIHFYTHKKIIIMNAAQITKTVNKVNSESKEYSIGFRRLISLPVRVSKNIILACVLNGENDTNSMKEFLNTLTEQEFINWLKLA